jgi:hypothetical protein
MTSRKSAGTSLESAQEALAQTTALIADLEAQRRAALLGDDDGVVSRLSNRLEGLRRQRQTDADRVAARFEVAEKESQAKAAAERDALITNIETQLAARDLIASEMAAAIAQADRCFVKLIETARAIREAWPWVQGDAGAGMLTEGTVVGAIRAELYRIGGRPLPGGGMENPYTAPTFPGAVPERLEWAMLPAKSSRPLIEKFAEASVVAGKIMRSGRHDPVPEPAPIAVPVAPDVMPMPAPAQVSNGHAVPEAVPDGNVPVPTIGSPEAIEYSMLLARQVALVEGEQTPAAEAEYASIARRLEKLQATFA